MLKFIGTHYFFQLPSVHSFFDKIVADLAIRKNVLVLLPEGIDLEVIREQFRFHLYNQNLSIEDVYLDGNEGKLSPIITLNEQLDFEWKTPNSPRTVSNIKHLKTMADVIHIEGLENKSKEVSLEWIKFYDSWSVFCQQYSYTEPFPGALCIIIHASKLIPLIPSSSVNISVHWWWGFPSSLEIKLLCRMQFGNDAFSCYNRWHEFIISSISGGDIFLADYLWENIHNNSDIIMKSLCAFTDEKKMWKSGIFDTIVKDIVNNSIKQECKNQSIAPPQKFYNLWVYGALYWTPEYGIETSTALIVSLGYLEEFKHRLWRGQAELIIPIIDSARLMICKQFTITYGYDWPTRWECSLLQDKLDSVQKNPMSCQLGHIKYILKKYMQSDWNYLRLVSLLHSIRNRLAHYCPITYQDFDELCSEIELNL
ncbi:MAG: hypothetical protein HQK73_03805 [Desulfamplus sp.]|nr:hypothetical protein [Desulfamplus sp.]